MSQSDQGTYQMLWDCEFCGTKGLLGLDHRHCPACGSAQDEERRYFPTDENKVTVQDHVYHGADKDCPACSTPNAAIAKHCVNCGSPMDDAAQVRLQQEQPEPEPEQRRRKRRRRERTTDDDEPIAKKSGFGVAALIGCFGLILVIVVLVAVFWKKPVAIEVAGHTWERSIQVEQFGRKKDAAWCDQMPGDAYSITRKEEVRSHDEVPDGQTCTTKRRDNGDGSYTEYQDCKPKTKRVPVYDYKCKFTVDRWQPSRKPTADGDLSGARTWPAVTLSKTGQCMGCEREGARSQSYTVRYKSAAGDYFNCDWPEAKWAATAVGSRWTGKVGVMTKAMDCGSLAPE
jgi:hypothetical protein